MAFFTNLIIGMVSMLFLAMSLLGLQSPSKKE
jgi:Tfp pilus assembly protein PilV